jgi:hypothetical protein
VEYVGACLRGIRKCFYKIQSALQAQMPHQYMAERHQFEPGSRRPAMDERSPQAWVQALENLLVDPDADLPTEI